MIFTIQSSTTEYLQKQIKNGDILLTYIGMLCQGKPQYEDVREMMDDPDYVHKALNKINTYIRNGYIPGKNLLLTYESRAIPLNMRNAEAQLRAILSL